MPHLDASAIESDPDGLEFLRAAIEPCPRAPKPFALSADIRRSESDIRKHKVSPRPAVLTAETLPALAYGEIA